MAGAARFAGIHITHGHRLPAGTGRNNLVMAVVALIAASNVDFVAEQYRLDVLLGREIIFDRFEDRMTPLTVVSNSKCIFAIMAKTARASFFHVSHGVAFVDFGRDKRLIVTVIATI